MENVLSKGINYVLTYRIVKLKKKGYKIESSFINNDLNFHKLYFKHNIFYYQVFGKSISFHRVNSVFLTRI